jgi:hypothetical protein
VTLEELPKLSIEINVLTEITTIEPQDVVVGKHGLLLRKVCPQDFFCRKLHPRKLGTASPFWINFAAKQIYRWELGRIRMQNFFALNLNHGLRIETPLKLSLPPTTPFLFAGDAEKVHERMLSSVEIVSKIPGFLPLLRSQLS